MYVNMLNTYNLNLVARKKTSKLIQGYMVLIQIIMVKDMEAYQFNNDLHKYK